MNKYVYQVTCRDFIGAIYFSSWIKAFKYARDSQGLWNRDYEDNYITIMTNDKKTIYLEIRKEVIR